MVGNTKQEIQSLIKLQEAETEIVNINNELETIKKQQNKLSKRLMQFKDDFKDKEKVFLDIQSTCKNYEQEIQVIDDRIIKSNETLRMVRTNKEYQVILREIDDNKKRKDALEDELLESLDEKEKKNVVVQESKKELDLLCEQIKTEQEKTEKELKSFKKKLNKYLASQKRNGKNLNPSLMERFLKISKMNKGLAVINVKNEVCMGCYMNIPPQLYIEVQKKDSLISCPQCSRILYFKD